MVGTVPINEPEYEDEHFLFVPSGNQLFLWYQNDKEKIAIGRLWFRNAQGTERADIMEQFMEILKTRISAVPMISEDFDGY